MTEPNLDLSIATLARACKGNVKNLPSFVVHDNEAWTSPHAVKLDSKNRIHMRRATFLRSVSSQIPVRPGLWLRVDAQEFFIDLQPHHLQGSLDSHKIEGHKHSRAITLTDAHGRNPGDEGYGEALSDDQRARDARKDAAELARRGEARGIRSTALGSDSSE